jgi:hypothetical protein
VVLNNRVAGEKIPCPVDESTTVVRVLLNKLQFGLTLLP